MDQISLAIDIFCSLERYLQNLPFTEWNQIKYHANKLLSLIQTKNQEYEQELVATLAKVREKTSDVGLDSNAYLPKLQESIEIDEQQKRTDYPIVIEDKRRQDQLSANIDSNPKLLISSESLILPKQTLEGNIQTKEKYEEELKTEDLNSQSHALAKQTKNEVVMIISSDSSPIKQPSKQRQILNRFFSGKQDRLRYEEWPQSFVRITEEKIFRDNELSGCLSHTIGENRLIATLNCKGTYMKCKYKLCDSNKVWKTSDDILIDIINEELAPCSVNEFELFRRKRRSRDFSQCYYCLQSHNRKSCKQFACFKCGSVGHNRFECKIGNGARCSCCGKYGHNLSDCGVVLKTWEFNL